MSSIRLKLLIDPVKNRVVFAESEKEFVDILLSFLTLPIGTIIRLLNKQSSAGCIDNIYKSVENLDTKYMNTKACKTMLLEPRSPSEKLCEDLFIRIDDLGPRRIYKCPNFDCFTKKTKAFSSVAGVYCLCGKTMNEMFLWNKKNEEKQEVFLKGEANYIITDDCHVFLASVSNAVTCFQKLGINDVDKLKKRVVDINKEELLNLLKMLLLSKTPFTDVFLKNPCSQTKEETKPTKLSKIKMEDDHTEVQGKATVLNLVWDKNTKRVLFAETDHVMVDTLFSFLTAPLGSIVKLFNKLSNVGCVDNLYNSVDILATNSDCFVSEDPKKMLLSPCIYLHYDSSHQLLKIESQVFIRSTTAHGCKFCYEKGLQKCEHNVSLVSINEINPKISNLTTENGGGYAKKSAKFMITDEMMITPLSSISGVDVVNRFKVLVNNLVFQEIAIGEAEVMSLLKACLTSSAALNNVFSSIIKPT